MAKRILDSKYNPINERDIEKYGDLLIYEYDNAAEALLDLALTKNHKTRRFCGECTYKFDEITEPIIHNGVKLGLYFTWNGYVFCQCFGLYQYIGEMV